MYTDNIEFEWDENKNNLNIEKHGFSFKTAKTIFEGDFITFKNSKKDYGEERYISIGKIEEVIILVVHTYRNKAIRIISARKAKKKERLFYEKYQRKNN